MTELHITDPKPFEDDLFNEKSLRPVKLEDFIGQNELVDSLSLYIKDSLLSLVLGVVIISILFSTLNFLFTSYPDYWWFYIWCVVYCIHERYKNRSMGLFTI